MKIGASHVALLAGLAAAALSAACGGEDTPAPSQAVAELHVVQVWDETAGLYVEGVRSFIAVETTEGEEVLRSELEPTAKAHEATVRLDPGDYQLVSWQRPCSGNCGTLDPPTDRCVESFTVAPDDRGGGHSGPGCRGVHDRDRVTTIGQPGLGLTANAPARTLP